MPFEDELGRPLEVVAYRDEWATEFRTIASELAIALDVSVRQIDHIGSTAVPGLAAKDCIDVQVRVARLDESELDPQFGAIGFRRRPERWNCVEVDGGHEWPKLVYGSPAGQRAINVHVRLQSSSTARRNLLFRNFLRTDTAARQAWGDFKRTLADITQNLDAYGRAKQPATDILMMLAESWATRTHWKPRG